VANWDLTSLANGLRIVTTPMPATQAASVNIFVGVGSRSEPARLNGITHFLEHMVFKGTPRFPNIPQQLTAHGLVRRAVSGHSGVARRAKCLSQRIRARDRHGEGNRRTIGGILFMGSDDHLAARLGVEAIGQRLLLEVTRDGLHASEVDLGGNRVPGRLDQIALPHQIGNRDRERGGGEAVGHRLAVAALRRGRR
jgi:hypothetical protein